MRTRELRAWSETKPALRRPRGGGGRRQSRLGPDGADTGAIAAPTRGRAKSAS